MSAPRAETTEPNNSSAASIQFYLRKGVEKK